MTHSRFVVEKQVVPPEIPIWRIAPEGKPDAPLVLLQHGYTGNKDSVLPFGFQIAGRGFRVILPDARMHGDRRPPDFAARFEIDFRRNFLEVVEGTAEDVTTLIDAFGNGRPVGVVGISMGAFITYLAVTRETRIHAAVPLIGSGDYLWLGVESGDPEFDRHVAEINPARHLDQFPPCALLIQHGELDELVPIQPDRDLYERLRPCYAVAPDRLHFIPYPDVAHEVTPGMVQATLLWLERFMGEENKEES